MPKYRVKELSFIANGLVAAGTEIDFDGPAGTNLEPLDKAAEFVSEQTAEDQAAELAAKKRQADIVSALTQAVTNAGASSQSLL